MTQKTRLCTAGGRPLAVAAVLVAALTVTSRHAEAAEKYVVLNNKEMDSIVAGHAEVGDLIRLVGEHVEYTVAPDGAVAFEAVWVFVDGGPERAAKGQQVATAQPGLRSQERGFVWGFRETRRLIAGSGQYLQGLSVAEPAPQRRHAPPTSSRGFGVSIPADILRNVRYAGGAILSAVADALEASEEAVFIGIGAAFSNGDNPHLAQTRRIAKSPAAAPLPGVIIQSAGSTRSKGAGARGP